MTLALQAMAPCAAVEQTFWMMLDASAVAAFIFSLDALACSIPLSAISRNACGASIFGGPAGLVPAVVLLGSLTVLPSRAFSCWRLSGRAALDADRASRPAAGGYFGKSRLRSGRGP